MFAEVYIRRCRGKRLTQSEEMAQTPLYGALQFACVGQSASRYQLLTLNSIGNQTEQGELLRLYEPVMIGLGSGWISFRGFESFKTAEGVSSLVQEWRCRIVTRNAML